MYGLLFPPICGMIVNSDSTPPFIRIPTSQLHRQEGQPFCRLERCIVIVKYHWRLINIWLKKCTWADMPSGFSGLCFKPNFVFLSPLLFCYCCFNLTLDCIPLVFVYYLTVFKLSLHNFFACFFVMCFRTCLSFPTWKIFQLGSWIQD